MLALYLSVIETQEDRDKFEKMYIEYKQVMYAVAFRILKNEADAEDAVHQSFLKIANNFTKISQKSCQELKPYIVIICKNTALDMYRARKRFMEKNVDIDQQDIPDRSTIDDEDYDQLYSAIKDLPDIYKDVIYLHDLMGHSPKETAQLLSITTDVVYKRLSRAREKLRNSLEKGDTHAD